MSNVILFSGITTLDLPPDRILENMIGTGMDGVVIMGYRDGEEVFCSSYADGGTVLWLMERLKTQLLKVMDDV